MIIVIPAEQKENANKWFTDNIDPAGGENTFTIPLYDVNMSLCAYWCGIVLTEDKNIVFPEYMSTYDMRPDELLNELNLNLGDQDYGI